MKVWFAFLFLIAAVLLAGCGSAAAVAKSPEAPTGLTLEREEFDPANWKLADKIFLTWKPSSTDVEEYRVYRSEQIKGEAESKEIEYKLIGFSQTSNFTDSELCGTLGDVVVYHYRVTSVDADGNESLPSSEVYTQYSRYGLS